MQREQAVQIAGQLYDYYTKKGSLDIQSMMINNYKMMGKQCQIQQEDVEEYKQIIGNGQKKDFEQLCIRYFCNTIPIVSLQKKPKYSKLASAKLEIARKIFRKFDSDNSGSITSDEVRGLLIETYKQAGVKNYEPTDQDLKEWMNMTDTNGDGLISLEEFEDLVIRSLQSSGIEIYQK
ncbi:unnamed protein product [Paramecium sonneborni]|uniref:EF-hand domain-containing protein n=1 Tax=Paramecium sonneborni TaxID=65129 RepID=A0A8S1MBU9_9CILI|nr:unnamed protein product [Paramecium sonneborni]